MKKSKKDTAPHLDLRETARKAARFQTSHAEMLDATKLVHGAVNKHPEPVHEPVMPQEVFMNRMDIEDGPNSPEGHV